MNEPLRSGAGRFTGLGRLVGGVAVTLGSIGMLLGSFLLSRIDVLGVRPTPTQVVAFRPSPTLSLPVVTPSSSPSPTPTATETPAITEVAVTLTPTPPVSPTPSEPLIPICSCPLGWIVYTVRRGDTLASLAWRTNTTTYALMEANCLSTSAIYAGQRIYLPSTYYVSPTPPPYPCGPPLGWVVYYVQPGDTLYGLSRRFGVGIDAIRRANCLSGYTIYLWQPLYLPPPLHTPTPIPTPTFTPTPTLVPTLTSTLTLSPTPTGTIMPTLTYTPTPTGTLTLTPTLTPTPADGTPTPTPTATGSPTPTPTPTGTPATPTYTPTPTPGG